MDSATDTLSEEQNVAKPIDTNTANQITSSPETVQTDNEQGAETSVDDSTQQTSSNQTEPSQQIDTATSQSDASSMPREQLLDSSVNKLRVGLGWDKTGADLDLSAVLYDKHMNVKETVYYANGKSECGSVSYSGDNRTGADLNEDEWIDVEISKIRGSVHHILFIANVYQRDDRNTKITGEFVRVRQMDKLGFPNLQEFKLDLDKNSSVLTVQLARKGNRWMLKSLQQIAPKGRTEQIAYNEEVKATLKQYPSESLQVRKISVCVIKGTNLIAKDSVSWFNWNETSDPYYVIRFADRQRKSEYVPKTLKPEWKAWTFDLGYVSAGDSRKLVIEVFDYDFGRQDDLLGTVSFSAGDLYAHGSGVHLKHPKLDLADSTTDSVGELHLKLVVGEDMDADDVPEN